MGVVGELGTYCLLAHEAYTLSLTCSLHYSCKLPSSLPSSFLSLFCVVSKEAANIEDLVDDFCTYYSAGIIAIIIVHHFNRKNVSLYIIINYN